MAGEKLRLVKEAVAQSIRRLQSGDRFSVVVYDDQIDVVFDSALATADNKQAALLRLAGVEARNMTNLGDGWLRGCEQVARFLDGEGVNRTILLTDGLANVGMTDHDELAGHAAALRQRGVSTTTFGVGTDFDDVLLQAMATAGGGNYYYIATDQQIVDYITSEVGEALDVVARNVTLDVVVPDGVTVESLSPYPVEMRGGRASVTIGALIAEQVIELVLRLNFPYGELGREMAAVLSVGDEPPVSLAWEYADSKTNDTQERDIEVDRAVARVFADRARQEAAGLNRAGQLEAARATLASVAKRVRTYAGRDAQLREVVAELERGAHQVAEPMPEASRKEMYFRAYTDGRARMPDGKAIKGR